MIKKATCWNCGRKVKPNKQYKHKNLCKVCIKLHYEQKARTNKLKLKEGY